MTRAIATLQRARAAVRLVSWRAVFAAGEVVAPARAAQAAADLWFTVPDRAVRSTAPAPGGAEFAVPGPFGRVVGTVWGTGRAVYFMHGWGGRGDQVGPLVHPLVARGYRVVTFDAPGHGRSSRDSTAARQSNAVEFGEALDRVVQRYGPPHAVVAHSLGAIATGVALHNDWLSTERLVLVAPLTEVGTQLDSFSRLLRLGARVRARLPREVRVHTGLTVGELTLDHLMRSTPIERVLLIHDRDDRFTPYEATAELAHSWPEAELMSTTGLGHARVLADPGVVERVIQSLDDATTSRTRVSAGR
ncbi:MAG: alpha/beta fold hydrolase [Propionibacteriaceae bacterium]